MKIAVAGTGYVGLSIATLLSQHNEVMAVDIIPEKVNLINQKKSPIQDEYIEKYLAEKDLNLVATLDAEAAYKDADFVVIAAPTNSVSYTHLDVYKRQAYSLIITFSKIINKHFSISLIFSVPALLMVIASGSRKAFIILLFGIFFVYMTRSIGQSTKPAETILKFVLVCIVGVLAVMAIW